jgi:hypothetical protein
MKSSTIELTEATKNMLLIQLQEHRAPMSLERLAAQISRHKGLSDRVLKEAAWKLVEEGKAQFNSTWDLEIL